MVSYCTAPLVELSAERFRSQVDHLDPPVALRPALLLCLESLKQAASVEDGGVDRHVVHEGEGGVKAHVALVHPVPPLPLLPLLLLLTRLKFGCCFSKIKPLGG